MARFTKNRLKPYQLWCLLRMGDYPFLKPAEDDKQWRVAVGNMARLLRVSNSRFREYMNWLEAHGYLHNITHTRGAVQFEFPEVNR